MVIKEMAENMGFEVLHGIVDCLWVIGEPISVFKEAVERNTGILADVDSYDWIAFLPMSALSRYFLISPLSLRAVVLTDACQESSYPIS